MSDMLLITQKLPKADEILWVIVDDASQDVLDQTRTEIDEHTEGQPFEGSILISNFEPGLITMTHAELLVMRDKLDFYLEETAEPLIVS